MAERLYHVQCWAEGGWNAFVTFDENKRLPRHTFHRPEPMPLSDARKLKEQAARLVGGDLRVKAAK